MDANQPVFSLRKISKHFPGVKALDNVKLDLYAGKVTALVGENGAGKSTLVKVMTGIYTPTQGQLYLDAEQITLSTPDDARKLGITAIHQETVLFDELSVAENIFVGHHLMHSSKRLNWREMERRSVEILQEIDAPLNPRAILKDLSIGQRHMVAIARALSFDARVVVLDEPTAALSHREIEDFYAIVERLKQKGCAILFISHKFDEIFRIADNYCVFRDGCYVGAGQISGTQESELVTMMVGRSIENAYPKVDNEIGDTVLSVSHYSHPTEFDDISFELHEGEILGFYGLVGAGRTELMQSLFGVSNLANGEVKLDKQRIKIKSPSDAIKAGIVYVPEERQAQGTVLEFPIFQNIGLPQLEKINPNGLLDEQREYALAETYANRLRVKAPNWYEKVENLSGGNQQKVVIGKWLATRPQVIILDEPTKGIDIGSKAAVHEFMSELTREGLAVIMVSSELPEVMGMADRIIVMREGLMVKEYARHEFCAESIVSAATGLTGVA
ncbi:sugar ABC transporter ATP-binding protein [Photobacterium sp. DNB23_23_1]|uniref:Sugar ABC transporter ATP-binding protein n=1 Tax=Photobacterium pectinilyticum TaxID=2906793 RepID=A0ABT1N4J1_9GAMM|nr:sugar ABC transporter ATP-binding protein [Photobacterium sp. ZSDE20]MCQ1059644.1 sugar ABC transporter ATP-binding protein [Photobacterium sp. ZSDE20]MDD1825842.1 sugar ABC transporter ATP-binding protein [Photobacterium sp. ZSDE20]